MFCVKDHNSIYNLQNVINMTKLKYCFVLCTFMKQESVLDFSTFHAKPKNERQSTYFCRLCRSYNIKLRKAHLQNYHNANRDTVTKRSNNDLIDVIFIESK